MIRHLFLYIFFSISLLPSMTKPVDGASLNYIHVLFEWSQIEDASSYQIQIAQDPSFSIETMLGSLTVESLTYIWEDSNILLSWDETYYWRVRPIFSDGSSGQWVDEFSFSTLSAITNPTITVHTGNFQYGITFLGSMDGQFSAAYDIEGNEIWNTADSSLVMYNTNHMGELYGAKIINNDQEEFPYPAKEFNIDVDYLWEEPHNELSHHDIVRLPDGNYMSIVETTMLLPIPQGGPWYDECYQMMGPYCDANVFPWKGDKIVIWDRVTKDVLWEWNTFDHYNPIDFDGVHFSAGIYGGSWDTWLSDNFYDWTHVNAITYSEDEDAIYISCRHLSRITKIHFNSDNYNDSDNGNIIWNIGQSMPSGDVDCGDNLQFSWQHTVNVLDNGNIVTLDNGNLSNDFNGGNPLSRAIEIAPNIYESGCNAEIVWEYILPEELFGHSSGGVQKLDNGNYLISTVGDGGTTLEVTSDTTSPEIVWEAKYNLFTGLIHRAFRVSSLYPVSVTATVEGLTTINESAGVYVPTDDGEIKFTIHNNGSMDESFNYMLSSEDNGDWYSNIEGNVFVESYSSAQISVFGDIDESDEYNNVSLIIESDNNLNISKTYNYKVFANSDLSNEKEIQYKYNLLNIYPNPFNPSTTIEINLNFPIDNINIDVYDINGHKVEKIFSGFMRTGLNTIKWTPKNLSSGKYFIKMISDDTYISEQVVFIK